jgi:oligopeptide/dipeptide ABC transporter ATP-binding protein
MTPSELQQIRGRDIALIAQDPAAALNPLLRIGDQITDVIEAHSRSGHRMSTNRCRDLLTRVGLPEPDVRARQYPHQLSGGMLQRAMIAMAIANDPKVLLADEPTTALDVTIQAQILELLKKMQSEIGTAIVLVTHDLGVVAEVADRVVVMYAGRVVEIGPARNVLKDPWHPYTSALLGSLPSAHGGRTRLIAIPGQPPSLTDRPSGCAFHPRCQLRRGRAICVTTTPTLQEREGGLSACHFADEMPITNHDRRLRVGEPPVVRPAVVSEASALADDTAGVRHGIR